MGRFIPHDGCHEWPSELSNRPARDMTPCHAINDCGNSMQPIVRRQHAREQGSAHVPSPRLCRLSETHDCRRVLVVCNGNAVSLTLSVDPLRGYGMVPVRDARTRRR